MSGLVRVLGALFLGGLLLAGGPAGADTLRRSVDVEPGGRLRVDLSSGAVVIDTHREPTVRVEADSKGLASMTFELTSDGRDAELVGERAWGGWFQGAVRVHVRVPRSYSLDIETSGANVEIERIQGDVRVETSGGSIDVSDVRGKVDLETSGGPIRVEQVVGDLKAETSGGRLRVSEIRGRVDLEPSGGPILASALDGPREAATSGGSSTSARARATRCRSPPESLPIG